MLMNVGIAGQLSYASKNMFANAITRDFHERASLKRCSGSLKWIILIRRLCPICTHLSISLSNSYTTMSQSSHKTPSDPLLGCTSKLNSDPPPRGLSLTTRTTIKALSIIRIATGAACLLAPRFTCAIFKYNVPAEHALLVRMFGVRDAVLGELLITADDEETGRR